ncbi:MAG: hypothetical protein WA946_06610, partial [Nitrospirota bacterium]
HLQGRLIQERDRPEADPSVQDTDAELIPDRSAVNFKNMLEPSALESNDCIVDEVVLEKKDEVHSEIMMKF